MLVLSGCIPLLWVMIRGDINDPWHPIDICTLHWDCERVSIDKLEEIGDFEPSSVEVVEEDCWLSVIAIEPSVSGMYPEH